MKHIFSMAIAACTLMCTTAISAQSNDYGVTNNHPDKYAQIQLSPYGSVIPLFAPRATYGHQGFGEGSYNYFGLGFDFTSIIIGDVDGNTRLDQTKTLYLEAQFGTASVASPGLPFNDNGSTSMSKSTKGFILGFRSTSWFNTGLYIDLAVGYPMLFSGKMGVAINTKKR